MTNGARRFLRYLKFICMTKYLRMCVCVCVRIPKSVAFVFKLKNRKKNIKGGNYTFSTLFLFIRSISPCSFTSEFRFLLLPFLFRVFVFVLLYICCYGVYCFLNSFVLLLLLILIHSLTKKKTFNSRMLQQNIQHNFVVFSLIKLHDLSFNFNAFFIHIFFIELVKVLFFFSFFVSSYVLTGSEKKIKKLVKLVKLIRKLFL